MYGRASERFPDKKIRKLFNVRPSTVRKWKKESDQEVTKPLDLRSELPVPLDPTVFQSLNDQLYEIWIQKAAETYRRYGAGDYNR